jgi:predicted DNA-binding transcriptional regulator AlpA
MPLSEHTSPPKVRAPRRSSARAGAAIVNRDEDIAAGDTRTLIGGIPEAWPTLLTREQACAYVGMSADSMARTCPVPPVALGVKLLRWRRKDIDAWVEDLPSRLLRHGRGASGDTASVAPQPSKLAGEERRNSALARAGQRALKRGGARR